MNYADIKAKSIEQLRGNWLKSACAMLIMTIITLVIYWFINGILSQILVIPVSASITALMFRMANNEGFDLSKLILSKAEYIRYFVYRIIITVIEMVIGIVTAIVVLGGMMFSIVGASTESISEHVGEFDVTTLVIAILVYLGLTILFIYIEMIYSMTPYIIFRNNEDIDAISSMRYSRELMKGYKWNLFVFILSFIGWAILSICTLGIGFLFLAPYVKVSVANYYLELVKVKEEYAREKGLIYRENENYYRTFVKDDSEKTMSENGCVSYPYDLNSEEKNDSEENDPMNVLTVEKLTTIENYENNDDKN